MHRSDDYLKCRDCFFIHACPLQSNSIWRKALNIMNSQSGQQNKGAKVAPAGAGRGVASIAGAGLFFSLNTPLARVVYNNGSNPGTVVFLRVLMAVIGIAAMMLSGKRPFGIPRQAILPMFAVSASISVQSICYLSSIAYIPVGLAALLFYTFPLMVALGDKFMDGVILGTPRAVAFSAAFGGIALAIGPTFDQLDPLGIALALMAAFANMLAFRAAARALRHTGSVSVSFYGNLGSLPLLALALVLLDGLHLPDTLIGWSALAAVGLCYTLAMLMHFAGIGLLGTTHASLIYNLEPLFSIAAAAILLGERLTSMQYLGGFVVVSALVTSDLLSNRSPRKGT